MVVLIINYLKVHSTVKLISFNDLYLWDIFENDFINPFVI